MFGTWFGLVLRPKPELSPTKFRPGMSSIDSEAFFDARVTSMNITPATAARVRAKGWTTLGGYAYSCGYVPGQAGEELFVDKVLEVILGNGHGDDAIILRGTYYFGPGFETQI